MSSTGARYMYSIELKRFDLKIGHPNSSPIDGHQGDMESK